MKRHGGLWEELTSFHNLLLAARKAARGKTGRTNVARFRFDLERQLVQLQQELQQNAYRPGMYRTFEICEPKRRLISAAPFRDRVVHHALCNIIEPLFERTFIHDSYACRKGKGTHAAVDQFQHFARSHRFVLKCDLKKFFPSVDHQILKAIIARKVKDKETLRLIDRIIDHSNEQELIHNWFPGDHLLSPLERRRGLPLGNQTSQFFANVLLNPFDHFVKETLRVRGYVRYVDDFALFANSKAQLASHRETCRQYLSELRLKLHPGKSVISRVIDGCPFLGVRIFPHRRFLPRQHLVRVRKRMRRMQRLFANCVVDLATVRRRVVSWLGHAKHADSQSLQASLLNDTLFRRDVPVN